MPTAQSNAKRKTATSRRSNGSATKAISGAARQAKGPALASGAAVAGLAAGAVLGSKLRAHRRPHLLGLPMPRGSELKSGAKQAARAGRWAAEMRADVLAVRAQAEEARRQSPIEVLLSGLTTRRIPRRYTRVG
jgi:hypothetical protein